MSKHEIKSSDPYSDEILGSNLKIDLNTRGGVRISWVICYFVDFSL